jgi:hypothetical protein
MKSEILKEKLQKQGGRVFERETQNFEKETAFAICVKSDEEELLVPLKVYEVTLSKTEYVGVIDENGEKAIYPANFFVLLDLTPNVSRLIKEAVELV